MQTSHIRTTPVKPRAVPRITRIRGIVAMVAGAGIAAPMAMLLTGGWPLLVTALFAWGIVLGLGFVTAGYFLARQGAMPPPVRYTLIALLACSFLALQAWNWAR